MAPTAKTLLVPPRASLAPSAPGLCPTAGWGSSSISEPGAELLHLQQVSGAGPSSKVAVRGSLLLEAVLFHPAPISCWWCCSFMSPAQYQMGMLLVQVHKRPKGALPFWARAADSISFQTMPALVSFNSFEVLGFFFLRFPYRLLTDNPIVALLKQTLLAVWS